jgi:hypothetical protein
VTAQRDVFRGFEDSSIKALMLQAAAEVRACNEAIDAASPEMPGDLKGFAGSLDLLSDAIDRAAAQQMVMWLDPDPVPSGPRPPHLHSVGGDR